MSDCLVCVISVLYSFLKKFLCSYPTVIFNSFDLILVGNYIYIRKHMCYHYTLVILNAETYCIWS